MSSSIDRFYCFSPLRRDKSKLSSPPTQASVTERAAGDGVDKSIETAAHSASDGGPQPRSASVPSLLTAGASSASVADASDVEAHVGDCSAEGETGAQPHDTAGEDTRAPAPFKRSQSKRDKQVDRWKAEQSRRQRGDPSSQSLANKVLLHRAESRYGTPGQQALHGLLMPGAFVQAAVDKREKSERKAARRQRASGEAEE